MDGEPPQEEDFSQIPLVERSQHKNWKARLSAYNDVISKSAKTASDTDPFFRPYISDPSLLKKWCLDANVVAQEKGIEAVLAIVQNSGESSAKCRSEVVPGLVEKALGSARAGTKKKGSELCAMFAEVENGGEGVMTDVLVGLDSKQPKVVAGAISCIKDLIEAFGVPTMGNIKPLLKNIRKMFGHTDKTVRAEATSLCLILYTYLGPAIQPSLAELKPVQQTDLQKAFDSLDGESKGAGSGKPSRFTRKVQRERETSGGDTAGDDAGGPQEEETAPIDPRSFLDPVNALALFPSDLEERITSSKWKDRLEVLEECNKVLAQPQNAKIADNNIDGYSNITNTLGSKIKSDANVNVVIEAAKLVEGLANGIGKPFGRFRGSLVTNCLERLKERKANVVEAIGKALDAVFATVSFPDIVEDVLGQVKSKNPQVKEGTLKFLHRSLQTTIDAPAKDQVKPLAEALVSLLGDSAEPVRTSAAECLGTMMKILGERAFNPYIEGVGEIQMAKVKDAFAKAEIRYRVGGAKPGPTKPAAGASKKTGPARSAASGSRPASPPIRSAAPPSSPPIHANGGSSSPPIKASGKFNVAEFADEFAPPSRPPPARFAAKAAPKPSAGESSPPKAAPPVRRPPALSSSKPAAPAKAAAPAATSKPNGSAKSGSSKTLTISPSEPVKFKYSSDDAMAQAADVVPAEYHTKFADAAWKTRLEGAEEMVKWVGEDGGAEQVESEILMRFLSKVPGWGEKNFQVSAKLYQVMQVMAEKSPTFGRSSAALCIGPLSDKLGDIKLKKPAGEALTAFAERTSLAFVLAQAYEPMTKQKAPKAQADALTWIKQQLNEFGIAGIPLRDLIGFVKTGLGSPNAMVRSSATQVLVTIKIFVGADISGFLEDLNPTLLTTINSEFDKAASQTPPEPTRTQADLQDAAPGASKASSKGGADPLDDLIPRVDLDKLVNQTSVIADSKSDAWKTRKEAFEALSTLLEVKSNSRLKSNMGEIATVLKKAMADTNLSVKMLALGIISKIATGMGQPFEKYSRILVAPVCSVCADQKATTRSAAIATLAAIADATGGLDSMYAGIGASLETTNPALRASVLAWVAERLTAEPPQSSADLSAMAGPIISCLEDRNGDVRKGAGAILSFVVASTGVDFVLDQTNNLKPASRATIIPLINNAKANAPAPSAAAPSAGAGLNKSTSAPKSSKPASAATSASNTGRSTPASPRPTSSPRPAATSALPGLKPPARSLAMKALTSAASSRPPSSLGEDRPTGLVKPRTITSRPTSAASHAAAAAAATSSSSSRSSPFLHCSPDARAARAKKDSTRWVLENPPKYDLAEYLYTQMEPTVTPELFSQLFSKDHRAEEDYMAALTVLSDFYDDAQSLSFDVPEEEVTEIQLANVDLALKYAALRLLSNNTQMNNRCLEVVSNVVSTLQRLNERFSDGEAKLFVPALIYKLGDAKFQAKLIPIFESLDKVIAGSQVVQLLVQYGLEDKSSGKSCKNESLGLIEKAYRKRGSILRTRDDRAFFEVVARCISDSGTRNAALSVMALLQMQGASKALEAVIEAMPQGSKDMLANRRATMATAKPGMTNPIVARATADAMAAAADSPSRLRRPNGTPTNTRIARDDASPAIGSPAHRAGPNTESPSRLPKATASPLQRTIPGPSALPRATTSAIPSPLAAPQPQAPAAPRISDVKPVPDVFNGKPSLQPLGKPKKTGFNVFNDIPTRNNTDLSMRYINDIRNDDLDRAVDALKHLQIMLTDDPDAMRDNVQTLIDTIMDQMDRAFTPPENLRDGQYFRLVKHLIQTASSVSSNQDLMRQLSYDNIYALIAGLTLHLVQADRLGGHISELSKFLNMIILQALSTPDRLLIFRAMFKLLLNLIKDFGTRHESPTSIPAFHADLVLKCMWKRSKVLEDDFKSGRLPLGQMLSILEEFVQTIQPTEFRRRAQEGIALGDMPLRTVKTIIQKMIVYTKAANIEIYDILLAEFGDDAANTTVYSYIFRLAGADSANGQSNGRATISANGEKPSTSRPRSAASQITQSSPVDALPPAHTETESERIVRRLISSANQAQQLDDLYLYVKANPDKENEVYDAISGKLSGPVQTFVRRALEQRKTQDNPSPSRPEGAVSPLKSPSRSDAFSGPSARAMPRRSIGPRPPSMAVDKSAPVDDQIANIKNIFARGAMSASNSHEAHTTTSRPLSEISPQEDNMDVD